MQKRVLGIVFRRTLLDYHYQHQKQGVINTTMLDLTRLENVKTRGNKITAACPACRAADRDKKGVHLYYNIATEKFGCVAHQGDSGHQKAIWSYAGIITEPTEEQKAEWMQRKREENTRECMRILAVAREREVMKRMPKVLDELLSPYIVDDWYLEFLDQSPIRFHDLESLRHEFIIRLFYCDDILWLGDSRKESGQPRHTANFRTAADWLKMDKLPQMIAAGVFDSGTISRGKDFVVESPYIVIECDELIGYAPKTESEKAENKKLSAALIRYAQDRLGLILRAVIDTGNKSLHAWFDRPPESVFQALVDNAERLRIDSSVLNQCQYSPLRLPNCIHEKSNQEATLIYLNPITK